MIVLSLDFGGTKLAAGLVDPDGGEVLDSTRCASPPTADAGYAAMLGLARELLARAPTPPQACGISFGGPVAADQRTIRRSMHVPGWECAPLAAMIERDLNLPCVIANDGDAAALAEQRHGAGKGAQSLIYLTISTGIGGGIVLDGRVHRGVRAMAGEIGHQVLDPAGPPCTCGGNGCLEALAAGPAIARAARMRDAQAVAEAVRGGDPAATIAWTQAINWIAIGIVNAANLLNPDCVVLGGGVTHAGPLFFEPLRNAVAARCLDPELRVLPASLGPHVGLVGAALVVTAVY